MQKKIIVFIGSLILVMGLGMKVNMVMAQGDQIDFSNPFEGPQTIEEEDFDPTDQIIDENAQSAEQEFDDSQFDRPDFNDSSAQEPGLPSEGLGDRIPKTELRTLKDILDEAKSKTPGVTLPFIKYLPTTAEDPTDIIYRIIDIIFLLAGVVGVIFIIVAAIKMIFNMGDEEMVKSSVMMIKYTIAGLLIIILSYAAVNFVIRSLFFGGG